MSVDKPDPDPECAELRKMKTNACLPQHMSQNAVVQPLLTGLLIIHFIFLFSNNGFNHLVLTNFC